MPHDFTLQTHPRRSANRWPSLNPEKWPEGLKSGAQSTARGLGLRCNDVVSGDAALPLPFKGRFRSPPRSSRAADRGRMAARAPSLCRPPLR